MSCSCGCCDGVHAATPLEVANGPGLRALRYRLGEYGDFLESMLAGLSGASRPALAALRTRDPSDPSIALLDAAATLLDVLTFYQERIANESYLRTAVERRSLIELARLVGYRPRPGVSASAYLAFTVEQGGHLTIPTGTKAQSVPGQDELPQAFETSAPLEARAEWNQLNVRRTRPQLAPIPDGKRGKGAAVLYFKGVLTGLRKGDPLLVEELESEKSPSIYRVMRVEPDAIADRTRVEMIPWITMSYIERVRSIALSFSLVGSPLANTASGKQVLALLGKLVEIANEDPEEEVAHRTREITDDLIAVNAALPATAKRVAPWLSAVISTLEDTIAAGALISKSPKSEPNNANFNFGAAAGSAARAQPVGPRNAAALSRNLGTGLGARSAATLGVVGRLQPALRDSIPSLVRNANVAQAPAIRVFALRSRASLFGHNAPKKLSSFEGNVPKFIEWTASDMREAEDETTLHLDAKYEAITPGSWVVVDTSALRPNGGRRDPQVAHFPLLVTRVETVNANESRSAYGISGPSTNVTIGVPWLLFSDEGAGPPPALLALVNATGSARQPFDIIRRTGVLAASDLLELAEAPIETPLCDGTGAHSIELSDIPPDLVPGRWVIVTGERTDIPGTSGITGTELRMIADVQNDVAREGDKILAGEITHTFVTLASKLAYCYRRSTVTIWGNVVDATHGETRLETLGDGNGAEAFQRFTLKASPLTYTAAATAEGAASSLEVRVNEVRWYEREMLAGARQTDHVFVARTAADDKTSITFGDGRSGARLPTGRENVRAVYRTGIGRPGNVDAGRISLLASRPIGLKEVTNPLRASGGADADSAEQLRRNIPIALQALDRLVSVRDHADFARAFAGIGKSSATRLSDGRREIVHVTIAGVDDVPIIESSDLFTNLHTSFSKLGNIRQPVELAVRELVLLVIAARVRVGPDYRWDLVEPHVRAALLDAFGFERRELGQPATSSEVIATIQRVSGVDYVDLDIFGGIPEYVAEAGPPPSRRAISPDEIEALINERLNPPVPPAPNADCSWLPPFCPVVARLAGPDVNGLIRPAQLAILSPDAPNTLVLSSIP